MLEMEDEKLLLASLKTIIYILENKYHYKAYFSTKCTFIIFYRSSVICQKD